MSRALGGIVKRTDHLGIRGAARPPTSDQLGNLWRHAHARSSCGISLNAKSLRCGLARSVM
eukprot:13066-Amphidinium_carterae.1